MSWNVNENTIVKYDFWQLNKIGNSIAITNKLLRENERSKIIDLFCANSIFFVQSISWFYPLNDLIIDKYNDRLDFQCISANISIPWSEELIEKYKDKWNWDIGMSSNRSLPWSETFLEKYNNKWDWLGLETNKGLIDQKWFIEKYKEKFILGEKSNNIKRNKLSENEIDNFIKYWDWDKSILSTNNLLPWSRKLILKYEDKWDWNSLSDNQNIPWSIELIEEFRERWDWKNLSLNKSLPWSEQLMEKYATKWYWQYLFLNTAIQWSMSLLSKFHHFFELKVRCNEFFWQTTFEPFVDDLLIEEVMKKIYSRTD
jgi:hypothetical protein